jgi:hypothetical protein
MGGLNLKSDLIQVTFGWTSNKKVYIAPLINKEVFENIM